MTWTNEKPTQSGWYWWREHGLPLMGVIVQVDVEADTPCIHQGPNADALLDQMIGGEWYGSLEMPE